MPEAKNAMKDAVNGFLIGSVDDRSTRHGPATAVDAATPPPLRWTKAAAADGMDVRLIGRWL